MEWNFGDVLLSMLVFFGWVLFIWMFIAVFGDIFRRTDLSGWGKAGWTFVVFVLPLFGILMYMISRPKPTEEEIAAMSVNYGGPVPQRSPADEIAKLADLKQ